MRVMGIDPGYATTGVAVVERDRGSLRPVAIGTIKTPAADPQANRLAALQDALAAMIEEHKPAAVALERIFFSVNARTAIAVGQASGVAMAAAGRAGVDVVEYAPLDVKRSLTGSGTAPKAQVQAMVASLLHLEAPPHPPDAADACALAICHLSRSGLRRAVAHAEARR